MFFCASFAGQDANSSISVVVIVTVTVLTAIAAVVAIIVISVCVCLLWKRKNKHVNTTDNVAYHSSSGPDMKINEVINDPSISTSTNDAYGITHRTNDVTTSQNEAYGVITHPSSGSGVRMNLNEAYSSVNVPSQTGIKTSVNDAYIAVYDHELKLNEK